MTKIAYRRIAVDSIKIFYREAGRSNTPALLLLHGFPTASHMFRDLIPRLADRFHVIAARTTRFSCRQAPRRSSVTFQAPTCASSTPATSPSRRTVTR